MKRLVLCVAVALAATAALRAAAEPPLPATPAGVTAVLYARPFQVATAFQHNWRKERPTAVGGLLLVLQVDPALVFPRQSAEPVLYVGNETAMRLNVGYPSGRVVALVPGVQTLAPGTPIWFGSPRLPETVTADVIAQERALADAKGVGKLAGTAIASAAQRSGAAISTSDLDGVLRAAAGLVRDYAPDEGERASALEAQGR
jgi:hypothetical protein